MTGDRLKEKTAKGILWGGLNNGVQQLLNLIIGIFLARILTPEDYGLVGVLAVFSASAAAIQEGGFMSALNNRKTASFEDYNSVFWFSATCGFCFYVALFFCAPLISRFYEMPELTNLARFIFLGFVFSSLNIVPRALLFRNLKVKESSIALIISLFISGVTAICMAAAGFAYWALAVQTVVYTFSNTLICYFITSWHPRFSFSITPIKEMIGYSSKIVITNLFSIFNGNIFAVLLGKFYNAAEVGDFNQANKWTSMGYSLISGTIFNVAQPSLTKVTGDIERQKRVFRKMLRLTALVSFPAMLGLGFVAKDFIVLLITEKWLQSALIMQILCVWGAFFPIGYLFSNLLLSQGKSGLFMYSTIFLCLVLIAVVFFSKSLGLHTMLVNYVVVNIAWLFVWFYLGKRNLPIKLSEVVRDVCPYLFLTVLSLVATYFATFFILEPVLGLFAKIIIMATIYCGLLWCFKSVIFLEGLRLIRSRLQKQ